MAFQAPSCAAVGAVKAPVNQPRVAGENESSADLTMSPIVHPPTDNRPDLGKPARGRRRSGRHGECLAQNGGMASGERARYWQYSELPGVDLLHAHYIHKAFARHTHESFVFAAITEGVEAFHYRDELVHAGPGQIALVNPDTPHTGHAGVPEGWTYRTIYPDAGLVRSIAADTLALRGSVGFTAPVIDDPYAAQLVVGVHRAAEEGNALAADSLLRLVTARMLRSHGGLITPLPPRSAGARNAARARAVLEERMADPPTLERLAADLGTSPFALLRAFREAYGMPPHTWLTDARVRRARRLLDAGTPPADAAVAVGFTDQPHLNRHFTRSVGVPPGAYQRARGTGGSGGGEGGGSGGAAGGGARTYKTGQPPRT